MLTRGSGEYESVVTTPSKRGRLVGLAFQLLSAPSSHALATEPLDSGRTLVDCAYHRPKSGNAEGCMTTHRSPKTNNKDPRGGYWGKRHKNVTNRYLRRSARRQIHSSVSTRRW